MRIGRLRNRVTIQQLVQTKNDYNEEVESWEDYVLDGKTQTVWAEIEDLRGREYHQARQVPAAEVTTRVRIRYRSDIKALTFRIIHGTRILGIQSVIEPEGRRCRLELMCKEIAGESS